MGKSALFALNILCSMCAVEYANESIRKLRGIEGFFPCFNIKDSTQQEAYMLVCEKEASQSFGDALPIIQSDGIPISKIQIRGHAGIKRCSRNAFVNATSWTSNVVLHTLEIMETRLLKWEPECLQGLTRLRELRVINQEGTESLTGNLFEELKRLENLEVLHLVSVDLSEGIPKMGFGDWAAKLKYVHLEANRLSEISDEAFQMKNAALTELHLEYQEEGWKLLRNAQRWARNLGALELLSLKGSRMQNAKGLSVLDLGETANRKVKVLVLNECAITSIVKTDEHSDERKSAVGLWIAHNLSINLETLHLSKNHLGLTSAHHSALDGLQLMHNLKRLTINQNHSPLYTVPRWLGDNMTGLTSLAYLSIQESGITYLPRNAFPANLRVLHLSANPLRYVDEYWAENLIHLRELHLNYLRMVSVDISGYRADWSRALKPLADQLEVLSLIGCQLESNMFDDGTITPWKVIADHQWIQNKRSSSRPLLQLGLVHLQHLKILVLNNNELTHIPYDAFKFTTKLSHLVIAGNRLNNVEDPVLRHSTKELENRRLRRLDLRYNHLTTLNRCSIALGFQTYLENLLPIRPIWLAGESTDGGNYDKDDSVDLIHTHAPTSEWFGGLSISGNEFICDCRLAWLSTLVEKMEDHVTRSRIHKTISSGYMTYKKEALDFVCANVGPWKGHSFLSLKPTDLYAVDHVECRTRPDIYGSRQREQTLNNCAEVMRKRPATPTAEVFHRKLIAVSNKTENESRLKNQKSESINLTALSMGALILVAIAGVFFMCFIIIGMIVITLMCMRSKPQVGRTGMQTSKRNVLKRGREICFGEIPSTAHSICWSFRSPYALESNAPAQKRLLGKNNRGSESTVRRDNCDSSGAYSAHERPVDSFYSQPPDRESRKITFSLCAMKHPKKHVASKRSMADKSCLNMTHKRIKSGDSVTSTTNKLEYSSDLCSPHTTPRVSTHNASNGKSKVKDMETWSRLEPMPPNRNHGETKSSTEIRNSLPTEKDKQKLQCTNQGVKYGQPVAQTQEGLNYIPVFPWRAGRRNKPHGKTLMHSRGGKMMARKNQKSSECVKLGKSTGLKVHLDTIESTDNSDHHLRWKRYRAAVVFGWLQSSARGKRKHTTKYEWMMSTGSNRDETDNARICQGPYLPEPQFAGSEEREDTENRSQIENTNYLPMSPHGYGWAVKQSIHGIPSKRILEHRADKYVEVASNLKPTKTATKLRRRFSKSEDDASLRDRQTTKPRGNIYFTRLNDEALLGITNAELDLPPPPPPPPSQTKQRVAARSGRRKQASPKLGVDQQSNGDKKPSAVKNCE